MDNYVFLIVGVALFVLVVDFFTYRTILDFRKRIEKLEDKVTKLKYK